MKCSDVYSLDDDVSATSSRLLGQARARDPQAWHRLVRLYSRRMYRWCRQAGLQPADSANVVQEAFQAVDRKLSGFRRDRPGDTFRGWLRRIVENKIRDHFRRVGRCQDLAIGGTDAHRFLADMAADDPIDLAAGATPTDATPADAMLPSDYVAVDDERLAAVVQQVRGDVGERNWRFFWRTAVDGQSAADVGREFGASANAVRIVKMRVLRRLRKSLDDRPPEQQV